MSTKYEADYICLIWKDIKTRRNYIVGKLAKNIVFEFSYGFEVKEAIENGFELLIPFQEIDKIYKSDILFPVFSSRLPDAKRIGIEKILSKYELDEYNDYKLLKKSGAKLPIDNLEFIEPILDLPENGKEIKRTFYLAGPRHYIGCDGKDCCKSVNLSVNEEPKLELEPENNFDSNAIKVLNSNNIHIGYIPRYYCESIIRFINNGYKYLCTVSEVKKNNNCNECIKIKLEINS